MLTATNSPQVEHQRSREPCIIRRKGRQSPRKPPRKRRKTPPSRGSGAAGGGACRRWRGDRLVVVGAHDRVDRPGRRRSPRSPRSDRDEADQHAVAHHLRLEPSGAVAVPDGGAPAGQPDRDAELVDARLLHPRVHPALAQRVDDPLCPQLLHRADCLGVVSLDRAQRLMPASTACWSIAASSSSSKAEPVDARPGCPPAGATLLAPTSTDVTRGVAQRPGQRQLGQRLAAAAARSRSARGRGCSALLGEQLGVERLALRGPRVGRDAVEVAVGEHALGQRRERDAADALVLEDVEQDSPSSTQRLSIEYDGWWISSGVPRSRRIAAASRGALRRVRRDAGVQRPAGAARRCRSAPIVSSSGVSGSDRWE